MAADNSEMIESVRSYELQQEAHKLVSTLFQGALLAQWKTLHGERITRPIEQLSARIERIYDQYEVAMFDPACDDETRAEIKNQCFDQQCREIQDDVANPASVPAMVRCMNVLNMAALYVNLMDLSLGENEVGLQPEFLDSKNEARGWLLSAMVDGGLSESEADLLIGRFENQVRDVNTQITQTQRHGGFHVPQTDWAQTYQALCEQVTQAAKPAMHTLRTLPGFTEIYDRVDEAAGMYGVDDVALKVAYAHVREMLYHLLPNIDVPTIAANMKEQMPAFDAQVRGDTMFYRDIALAMSLEVLMESKLHATLAEQCDSPGLKSVHKAESDAFTQQLEGFMQIAISEGKAGSRIKAEEYDRAIRHIITTELGVGAGRS